jgi:CsoR family transcriptional regulator, copper-sensing transcriptional repressor
MKINVKKGNVQAHLHRIIGQLQGLERMIDEKRDCQLVINQLMAARASLEKLGILILQDESSVCFIGKGDTKKKLRNLEKITSNLFKLT